MRQCIICQSDISLLHGHSITCEGACRKQHRSNKAMVKYNAKRPKRFCVVCEADITHMDGCSKGCSRECKLELKRRSSLNRYRANPEKYRAESKPYSVQAYNEFAANEPEMYQRVKALLERGTRERAEQIVLMILYSSDNMLRRFRGSFKGDALLFQYAPEELI